jgi:hypothetical protein
MPMLMPSKIKTNVRKVLREAKSNHGELCFLTAYQILDRLPKTIKARLIRERMLGGKGTGKRYAAASVVADAAELLGKEVEVRYLDTDRLSLVVNKQIVEPSAVQCAIFRLTEA